MSAFPTALYSHIGPRTTEEEFTLPLSKEMSLRYHALIKTFEQFAELILVTIRIDVRCRTMYYLDSSMRHGHYSIDREAGEPDPHILDLNTELSECDDFFLGTVPKTARQYVWCVTPTPATKLHFQVHLRWSRSPNGAHPHLKRAPSQATHCFRDQEDHEEHFGVTAGHQNHYERPA